jgi:glycerophosphoryl diester phosphodiesterase
MIVLSHRGYWKIPSEKNTEVAFRRSFDFGFGTETDIRDCCGELVISHDMPTGNEMTLEKFLGLLAERSFPLALNIKGDGLSHTLKDIMSRKEILNWFVFDTSIPDMRAYLDAWIPVFTRMSEVESEPVWIDRAEGVWLDSFSRTWFDLNLVEELLERQKKRVCVVSSELHGRDPVPLWRMLRDVAYHPNIMICTDQPEGAGRYFGEQP